jgi:DNA-binding protein HU-beta
MTKAEIVNEISRSTGMEKAAVLLVVEKFMEQVKESMIDGESIFLRGFGSFVVKTRKAKTARNISKGTTIMIPEHRVPTFKPSKLFLDEIKKEDK